jgi:hypothetical protein
LNHLEYNPRKCIGRLDTWDSLHVNNSAFASRVNFIVLGDPAEGPNHDSVLLVQATSNPLFLEGYLYGGAGQERMTVAQRRRLFK